MKSLMYEVEGKRTPTWNPFAGCEYGCVYCYGPRVYAKFSKCEQCKKFTPHFHKERLKQKFKAGDTWFMCSMGDISFASFNHFAEILRVISKYPDTTFYIQSKNPTYFTEYLNLYGNSGAFIPSNVVLGTTIETNYLWLFFAKKVSKAPHPFLRKMGMVELDHPRKYVVIEPAMLFDVLIMTAWIREIAPEFVYIGYDNHKNFETLDIPEPPLEDTDRLIKELKKFTEVRLKTIRKAWWE